MKIMFICNQLGGGGAERVLTIIANCMASSDNQVVIYALNTIGNKYLINDNIAVNELDCKNLSSIKQVRLIRKKIKKEKPSVIISFEYHVNMKVLLSTRFLRGLKVIVSERNDPAQQKNRKILNYLRDHLYRKADIVVCQTEDAKAYFSPKVQRHAVVILNPLKADLPLYSGQNSKVIINFCRLEKQKNLPLLINAFELLYKKDKDCQLVIYGDGKEKDNLIEIIKNKELSDNVFIIPPVSNIHEIASACKVFVSSSDYEGLSNSMLEALAMGMPVVCTDCPCGGARMVIENEVNGLLVPVNDVNALYEAIYKIMMDDNLANGIAKNALKIREVLSQDTIAEKWINLLN